MRACCAPLENATALPGMVRADQHTMDQRSHRHPRMVMHRPALRTRQTVCHCPAHSPAPRVFESNFQYQRIVKPEHATDVSSHALPSAMSRVRDCRATSCARAKVRSGVSGVRPLFVSLPSGAPKSRRHPLPPRHHGTRWQSTSGGSRGYGKY